MADPRFLTGCNAVVAEKMIKFIEEDDKEAFYKLHKETADRILSFQPWRYAKILDLQQPIKTEMVAAAFCALSNVLRPESNIGGQYELAQPAHDYLWQAAKSYGINMSELGGTGADDPPTFPGNHIAPPSNVDLYSRSESEAFDPLFVKKEYPVPGQSLYKPRVAAPTWHVPFQSPNRSQGPQPHN